MTAVSDALITGAGSPHGIGIAIARCLAASGLKLAITSTSERVHDRASEMRENGYQVRSFVGDLTDFAVAQRLAAEVGPVSILINNAGMGSIREPAVAKAFVEYEERDWDRMIAVTLKTAFCATRAFLPGMIAARYGRIINVSLRNRTVCRQSKRVGVCHRKSRDDRTDSGARDGSRPTRHHGDRGSAGMDRDGGLYRG